MNLPSNSDEEWLKTTTINSFRDLTVPVLKVAYKKFYITCDIKIFLLVQISMWYFEAKGDNGVILP